MRHADHHRQGLARPSLHVAALPFPTQQGTQAVIRAMLETLAAAGRPSELLAYAHGEQAALPFAVRRAPDFARDRSLRSGPSLRKLAADAGLALSLARALPALDPELIVAHHVEAALLARLCVRRSPRRGFVFFAHTDLGAELPEYFAELAAAPLARAGGRLDAFLAARADAVGAISPALASALVALPGVREVRYVPPPWPLPAPIAEGERVRARADLGLAQRARVVLYAGNLDRYQGWEAIAGALAELAPADPDLCWLVGTESDPAQLMREARRAGIAARLRVRPLADEAGRRRLHAAADLAVIPRRTPGGLPIKLLDALARGVPCLVAPAATAGLALGAAVETAAANDGSALAAQLAPLLAAGPAPLAALAQRGRAYVAEQHCAERFLDAFTALGERARMRAESRAFMQIS